MVIQKFIYEINIKIIIKNLKQIVVFKQIIRKWILFKEHVMALTFLKKSEAKNYDFGQIFIL